MQELLGPRAELVYRSLMERIRSGELRDGDQIQSGPQLAAELGVAPMTVRAALNRLEAEGIIVRRHGRGTFVRVAQPAPVIDDDLESLLPRPYRTLFHDHPEPMWIYSTRTLRILDVNRATLDRYGYTRSEFLAFTIRDLRPPEDVPRLLGAIDQAHSTWRRDLWRHRIKSGSIINVEIMARDVCYAGERARLVVARDVTERHEAADALRRSEEHYRALVESSHDGIGVTDLNGRIVMANQRLAEMMGYREPGDLVHGCVLDLLTPDSRELCLQRFKGWQEGKDLPSQQTRYTALRADGTSFPVEVSSRLISGEQGGTRLSFTARDITVQRAYEEQLRHQALHDRLTALPNRTLFLDRLEQALLAADRSHHTLTVFLIDLDRFKEVNDTLGHHIGDLLLQQVAARFTQTLRSMDTVARLGGDEFGVLLEQTDVDGACQAAEKLETCLNPPFEVDGHVLYIGCSIGIALYPKHGTDSGALLRHADVAMYEAKRGNSGHAVYHAESDPHSAARLALISDLRHAIHANQLVLFYQPKIHLRHGCRDHVEALVRWIHPERGLIPPNDFVSVAEQTGLIKPLTVWIVDEALRQAAEWRAHGLDMEVAVNLSAHSLHDGELMHHIVELVRKWQQPASNLLVEITESALMIDPTRAMQTISILHDLGIRISIDDFGTGYSSLAYLRRLPVDEIKIDRSFVQDMCAEENDSQIIVRSVIDLGHNLGLQVVAEGIETEEQLALLQEMGCDLAQGYHVSTPLPAHRILQWMDEPLRLGSRKALAGSIHH